MAYVHRFYGAAYSGKGSLVRCITLAARGLVAAVLGVVAARAESFDKPLHVRVLDLGRSEYLMPYDHRHVIVTCWYYAHFMVKQQSDPGNKGAVLIAISPVSLGYAPRCARAQQPEEKRFQEWSEEIKGFVTWDGYFAGVKRDLVFLDGSDGDSNSGMPFTVFKADGQTKVFTDSAIVLRRGQRDLNFLPASGGQIVLRYLRVASASCSIPKLGEACWGKLKEQTGLVDSPMPKCSDYKGKEAGTAASVIAYPVEVLLFPKPSVRALGGPVRCYRAE